MKPHDGTAHMRIARQSGGKTLLVAYAEAGVLDIEPDKSCGVDNLVCGSNDFAGRIACINDGALPTAKSLMNPNYRFRRFLIPVIGILCANGVAADERYEFNQERSKISFEVGHLFGKARGQFHRFSGTIDLDREQPERSSVSARIEVSSIDTGIKKRDDHLCSPDFFNVQKFPVITFKSRSVKRTGDQSGDVTGDLTMHGVTRQIVLHIEMLPAGSDRSYWKVTTAPLNRRDFGLMFSGTTEAVSGIGKEVGVNIQIESVRAR